MHKRNDKKLDRIIDANFNRAKEGLRVCEDICRFIFDDKSSTRQYKVIRHKLTDAISVLNIIQVICSRDIKKDVGRKSTKTEFKRSSVKDIYYANSQRTKESIRVLEEFAKIRNKQSAEILKNLRYKVYALEKTIVEQC